MNQDIVAVIILSFSSITLWWLFHGPYREYRIDFARQRLFKARDELFSIAEKGLVSFDSDAYIVLRTTINGMIRFTHEFGLFRFLSIIITNRLIPENKKAVQGYVKFVNQTMEELPEETKKDLLEIYVDVHFATISHLVYTSFILWILFVPLKSLARVFGYLTERKIWIALRDTSHVWPLSAVDAEANTIGNIDDPNILHA